MTRSSESTIQRPFPSPLNWILKTAYKNENQILIFQNFEAVKGQQWLGTTSPRDILKLNCFQRTDSHVESSLRTLKCWTNIVGLSTNCFLKYLKKNFEGRGKEQKCERLEARWSANPISFSFRTVGDPVAVTSIFNSYLWKWGHSFETPWDCETVWKDKRVARVQHTEFLDGWKLFKVMGYISWQNIEWVSWKPSLCLWFGIREWQGESIRERQAESIREECVSFACLLQSSPYPVFSFFSIFHFEYKCRVRNLNKECGKAY